MLVTIAALAANLKSKSFMTKVRLILKSLPIFTWDGHSFSRDFKSCTTTSTSSSPSISLAASLEGFHGSNAWRWPPPPCQLRASRSCWRWMMYSNCDWRNTGVRLKARNLCLTHLTCEIFCGEWLTSSNLSPSLWLNGLINWRTLSHLVGDEYSLHQALYWRRSRSLDINITCPEGSAAVGIGNRPPYPLPPVRFQVGGSSKFRTNLSLSNIPWWAWK